MRTRKKVRQSERSAIPCRSSNRSHSTDERGRIRHRLRCLRLSRYARYSRHGVIRRVSASEGSRTIHTAAPDMAAIMAVFANTGMVASNNDAPPTTTIEPIARAFVRVRTQRYVCQSNSIRPNRGDRSNFSFHSGFDRMKHTEASRRNGVEGSSGRNAPTNAIPTSMLPVV